MLLNVHFYVTHEEFPGLIYYLGDLIKSNHIQRTVLFRSFRKIDFYLLLKQIYPEMSAYFSFHPSCFFLVYLQCLAGFFPVMFLLLLSSESLCHFSLL